MISVYNFRMCIIIRYTTMGSILSYTRHWSTKFSRLNFLRTRHSQRKYDPRVALAEPPNWFADIPDRVLAAVPFLVKFCGFIGSKGNC